ncbi:MAG: hypothetical protein P9L99_06150 [Candidatus Lernaella stagnicola]|nr:hypothetical protein [Candidatus Lernaella stagnicola]
MDLSKVKKSLLASLLVFFLCAVFTACEKKPRYEVLETLELDKIPALASIRVARDGYDRGQLVLVMFDALRFHVRNTRGIGEVLAVYDQRRRVWSPPLDGHPTQLYATDYEFASVISLSLDHIILPNGLGKPQHLSDAPGYPSSVRVGRNGKLINIEVVFNLDPLVIRKISYHVESDAMALLLESGATLHVRLVEK